MIPKGLASLLLVITAQSLHGADGEEQVLYATQSRELDRLPDGMAWLGKGEGRRVNEFQKLRRQRDIVGNLLGNVAHLAVRIVNHPVDLGDVLRELRKSVYIGNKFRRKL